MKGYEYQTEFARKYVAQGRSEGLTEGFTMGFTKGRTMGRAEEAARALLTVLRVRRLKVATAARKRILEEQDTQRLERWLERAAVAASVAAVLAEPN